MLSLFAALLIASPLWASEKPLPYFSSTDLTPYWESESGERHRPAGLEEFHTVDQDRRRIGIKDLSGKIALVNFFFTACPAVCPTMMNVLDKIRPKNGAVAAYSFSVTPESDTPAVLKKYALGRGLHLQGWHLLTGPIDEIYRIGRDMFKADGSNSPNRTSFNHTRNVYLLDTERRIRGVYDTGDPNAMKLLTGDIAMLERERSADTKDRR